MNIDLIEYNAAFAQEVKMDIVDFFAFHSGLVEAPEEEHQQAEQEAAEY